MPMRLGSIHAASDVRKHEACMNNALKARPTGSLRSKASCIFAILAMLWAMLHGFQGATDFEERTSVEHVKADLLHPTVALSERMASESLTAYKAYFGLTQQSDVSTIELSVDASTVPKNDNAAAFQPRLKDKIPVRELVGSASGAGRSAGMEPNNAQSSQSFACECGAVYDSNLRLRYHWRQTRCNPVRVQPPRNDGSECSECNEDDGDESVGDESVGDERLTREEAVCEAFLSQTADLHYEHHVSTANVQRFKGAIKAINLQQSRAIKEALEAQIASADADLDLDALIDPIMNAMDRYQHKDTESRAQEARLGAHRVKPRRRVL
jgi:hypothetical protein